MRTYQVVVLDENGSVAAECNDVDFTTVTEQVDYWTAVEGFGSLTIKLVSDAQG